MVRRRSAWRGNGLQMRSVHVFNFPELLAEGTCDHLQLYQVKKYYIWSPYPDRSPKILCPIMCSEQLLSGRYSNQHTKLRHVHETGFRFNECNYATGCPSNLAQHHQSMHEEVESLEKDSNCKSQMCYDHKTSILFFGYLIKGSMRRRQASGGVTVLNQDGRFINFFITTAQPDRRKALQYLTPH